VMDIYNNLYEEYIRRAVGLLHKYNPEGKEEKTQYKNKLAEFIVKNVNNRISNIFDRNRKYLTTLKENLINAGKSVYEIKFVSISRVLIDTSSPLGWLIDEVGIIWDPLLETPYIPSTQIMGSFRAAIEMMDTRSKEQSTKFKDAIWTNYKEKEKKKERLAIINFSSAYPIEFRKSSGKNMTNEFSENLLLEREVITPMYGENLAETDIIPRPIQLIVISRNVIFKTLLVIDSMRLHDEALLKYVAENLGIERNYPLVIDKLKQWAIRYLKVAIEEIGIGSKTSSNYGFFELL